MKTALGILIVVAHVAVFGALAHDGVDLSVELPAGRVPDALGVDRRSYLWAPAWLAAGLTYLAVAALFALGMIGGGLLVCRSYGVPHAWQLLTADFLDPRPERVRYALRAGFLVWMYAWGIASDVVAKGGAPKPEADAVTRGMTASVVACTLWVVAWELLTVIVVV